jgi:hypothetical protein
MCGLRSYFQALCRDEAIEMIVQGTKSPGYFSRSSSGAVQLRTLAGTALDLYHLLPTTARSFSTNPLSSALADSPHLTRQNGFGKNSPLRLRCRPPIHGDSGSTEVKWLLVRHSQYPFNFLQYAYD